MKLDHIGIAVKNLSQARKYFKKTYNFKPISKIINEPAHGVNVQFFDIGYGQFGPLIELISPNIKNSKISNFLKENEGQVHHLAYYVDDIINESLGLKKRGMLPISDIVPGAGHKKTRTMWLISEKKELIELIEQKKNTKFHNRLT